MTHPEREQTALRILLLEDNPDDAGLVSLSLREMAPPPLLECVESKASFREALFRRPLPDVILSDWSLPQFDGLSALLMTRELGLEIPFIIVSGKIGEEAAIKAIKLGAFDYVIKDNLGRLSSTIEHALDTERRRQEAVAAENALRESELRYRNIFQNNHTMMAILDPDTGVILDANPVTSAFLGIPATELGGHSLSDYLVGESRERALQELKEALNEERIEGSGICRRADGAVRDLEMNYSPIVINGKKHLYTIFHDVTEKKKAVESLRLQSAALNATVDAIVMTDSDGLVEWVNPAFCALSGYEPSDCLGKNILEISRFGLSKEDPSSPVCSGCPKRSATVCTEKACEVRELRKDGSSYIEEKRVCAVPAADGSVGQYVVIKQDITESWRRRRELETELRLNVIFRDASTPERIAAEVAAFLAEFPDILRAGILLAPPEGETGAGTWFGDPWLDTAGRPKERSFIRDLSAGTKKLGTMAVQFRSDAWNDDVAIVTLAADMMTNALNILYLRLGTEDKIRKIAAMTLIDKSIGGSIDLSATLELVLDQTSALLMVDAVAIYALDRSTGELNFRAGRGFKNPMSASTRIPMGQAWVGVSAKEDKTTNVFDFSDLDPGSLFVQMIRREGFLSQHCTPLKVHDHIVGVLEVFQRKPFHLSPDWNNFFQTIALQTAIAVDFATLLRDLQRTNEELEIAYEATIEGWSRAMDLRDRETEGHTQRVASLTVALARRMGLEDKEIIRLRRGALLHDLGKMGVPDSILNKTGPLDAGEWAIMRSHPELAMDMLSQIMYLGPSLDIPYCHHEKWDGTGYPRGLKGTSIPEAARIFAVVDVWDALTSDRPYRSAWSREKAATHIRGESGRHFDPAVVAAFLEMMGFREEDTMDIRQNRPDT
ncbi:MAG: HD domain-containing phosphohydrolase [Rectinema sp.]